MTEFFYLVGLLATLSTYGAVRVLTGSRVWALLACIVLVLDPGFHLFRTMYFYPWLIQASLAALLLSAILFLRSGRPGPLWATVLLLGVVVNTRSLFHPLWALGFIALLLFAARRTAPDGGPRLKALAAPLLLLLLFLSAWPIKNRVVFGQFTFSSLSGFNLSRDLPVDRLALNRYLHQGEVPAASQERAASFASRYGARASKVVSAAAKSTGERNWNHLFLLELNPHLAGAGLRWRARHVGAWLARAAFYYRCWALSTNLNPYSLDPMGSGTTRFLSYQRLWTAAFYADLRPIGRWLLRASGMGGDPKGKKSRYPLTLFGYVLLPGLLLLSGILALGRWPRRRPEDGAALLCLYCLVWVLAVPCLTDGYEGNRMRFGPGSMQLAATCYLLAWLGGQARRIINSARRAPFPQERGSPK